MQIRCGKCSERFANEPLPACTLVQCTSDPLPDIHHHCTARWHIVHYGRSRIEGKISRKKRCTVYTVCSHCLHGWNRAIEFTALNHRHPLSVSIVVAFVILVWTCSAMPAYSNANCITNLRTNCRASYITNYITNRIASRRANWRANCKGNHQLQSQSQRQPHRAGPLRKSISEIQIKSLPLFTTSSAI